MNSAISTSNAAGTHRPRVGMALIAALVLGGLVAAGAYAQRAGVFTMSDSGLAQSAALRAELTSSLTAAKAKGGAHHLLAWRAPKVPKITHAAPRVITPPPRVVTISAPAAPAAQSAAAPAAAPVAAPAPTTHGADDEHHDGGGSDD